VPAYVFQNIILHKLPDGKGWEIIGVHHDKTQKVITTLAAVTGEAEVKRIATWFANKLAGKPYAEVD
jgi:hypothetical protein